MNDNYDKTFTQSAFDYTQFIPKNSYYHACYPAYYFPISPTQYFQQYNN